jgi:hypothetical protein
MKSRRQAFKEGRAELDKWDKEHGRKTKNPMGLNNFTKKIVLIVILIIGTLTFFTEIKITKLDFFFMWFTVVLFIIRDLKTS